MPLPADLTAPMPLVPDGDVTVCYARGRIELSDSDGHTIYLDQTAMDAFDIWRAVLDAEIAADKARGGW